MVHVFTAQPMQIFSQNFYRNVPAMYVLAHCSYLLVAVETKMQTNEEKN